MGEMVFHVVFFFLLAMFYTSENLKLLHVFVDTRLPSVKCLFVSFAFLSCWILSVFFLIMCDLFT